MDLKKLLNFIALLAGSVYVVVLFYSGKLTYFIHPRYVTFSQLAAILGLAVGLVGILGQFEDLKITTKDWKRIWREFVSPAVIAVIFLVALVLPVRPLSSVTADQRSIDLNSLRASSHSGVFQPDTSLYSIGDWVYLIYSQPNWEKHVGKSVAVTGFVYKDSELPEGYFRVARFVLTCCAVDARPVGLIVKDNRGDLQSDAWIEVKGSWEIQKVKENDELVLQPDTISPVQIPNDPYIY